MLLPQLPTRVIAISSSSPFQISVFILKEKGTSGWLRQFSFLYNWTRVGDCQAFWFLIPSPKSKTSTLYLTRLLGPSDRCAEHLSQLLGTNPLLVSHTHHKYLRTSSPVCRRCHMVCECDVDLCNLGMVGGEEIDPLRRVLCSNSQASVDTGKAIIECSNPYTGASVRLCS